VVAVAVAYHHGFIVGVGGQSIDERERGRVLQLQNAHASRAGNRTRNFRNAEPFGTERQSDGTVNILPQHSALRWKAVDNPQHHSRLRLRLRLRL
jgi:hypothetical protein